VELHEKEKGGEDVHNEHSTSRESVPLSSATQSGRVCLA
jgi:hypothetical protein